jgi:hypothetical protein
VSNPIPRLEKLLDAFLTTYEEEVNSDDTSPDYDDFDVMSREMLRLSQMIANLRPPSAIPSSPVRKTRALDLD